MCDMKMAKIESFAVQKLFAVCFEVDVLVDVVENEEVDEKDLSVPILSNSDHSLTIISEEEPNSNFEVEVLEMINESTLNRETFTMIDSNKPRINGSFSTTLRDRSSCVIPIQPNRTLPLRPPPPTPVRNRSQLMKDNAETKTNQFNTPDIYEIICEKKDNEESFDIKIINLNDANSDAVKNVPEIELTYSTSIAKDKIEFCDNFKRKFDELDKDISTKSFIKNKHPKFEVCESVAVEKPLNTSSDSEDVMCIKRIDPQTSIDKNTCLSSNSKLSKDPLKTVPPLKLKKVSRDSTAFDEQEHLKEKERYSSNEIETSSYRIVSGSTPVPDSTQVLVSTTLTSNTTSFMPKNYIDNIRITIPSVPELGIQESYEITGPNFIATMTSKITNTNTHSSKLWQNPPALNTRKTKDKPDKSPSSSIKILEHNIDEPHLSSEFIVTSTDNVTPMINFCKSYEAINHSDLSLPILTDVSDIKSEQSVDVMNVESNRNLLKPPDIIIKNYNDEGNTGMKIYDEIDVQKSEILEEPVNNTFMSEIKEASNSHGNCQSRNEKKLRYRRNKLKLKLDELRNKAIELQRRMQSSVCILAANSPRRTRFRQTMNCYEKQIENLSNFLNKLSSNDCDKKMEDKLDEENKDFTEQKDIKRSLSLSPPKLLPTSPINFSRSKSPSEMRNSPPILPRICLTIPDDFETVCKEQDMNDQKSYIFDPPINGDKYCNESNESIADNSSLLENIQVKDSNVLTNDQPRQKIEIHDDECVEVTLLMKPMNEEENSQSIENFLDNYISCEPTENLETPEEQNCPVTTDEDKLLNDILNDHEISNRNADTPTLVIDEKMISLSEEPHSISEKTFDAIQTDSISNKNDIPTEFPSPMETMKELLIDEAQLPMMTLGNNGPVDLTVCSMNVDQNIPKTQPLHSISISNKPHKIRSKKIHTKKDSITSSYVMSGSTTSIVDISKQSDKSKNINLNDNIMFSTKSSQLLPINVGNADSYGFQGTKNNFLPINNTHQPVTTCNPACKPDANFRTKFTATSTTSLETVYSGPHFHDVNTDTTTNKNCDDHSQISTSKDFTEPILIANHKTRAVNQTRSAVIQNPQSPTINSNVSPNKINSDRNHSNHRVMGEQFPTFGTWAAKLNHKDNVRGKRKSNGDPKTNINNQQPTLLRAPEPESYKLPLLQNVEVTRSNYMIGNMAYIPRWNSERPLERQQLLQHMESLPLQSTLTHSRQRFFPATPIPRFYSNDYAIDPYATVFGYPAYPYAANVSYSPVQPLPAIEIQRMPLEGIRTVPYPAPPVLQPTDKRMNNLSGLRNITEFIKIPNPLASSAIERQHNMNSDYLRSSYNNCSIIMEPQYPRPLYRDSNGSQYDMEPQPYNIDPAITQKKQMDDLITQSRMIREQQIVTANSRNARYRNEAYRPANMDHGNLSTNVACSTTAAVSNNPPYPSNNPRISLPMREPVPLNRICETPNLGKIMKSPNSAQKLKCFNCGATNMIFQCLGCEAAFYCNEYCQAQHWSIHVSKCPKMMPKLKKVG